jgi:hypothetical protein
MRGTEMKKGKRRQRDEEGRTKEEGKDGHVWK